MASLLDFFAAPASGLLSGALPQRPQRGGLLPVDSFGAPPQSSSELDRLRGWAQRELTWGDFPAPSSQMPSYSSGVPAVGDLPMPMRIAAGVTPGLGDAMDIADIVGRATDPNASLHWSDAFAALPFIPAITAFHGTPHRFDKFSLEHIGRGEGAQVYGHGLYFAESPQVALEYQKNVVDASASPRRAFRGVELQPGGPEYHAARLVQDSNARLPTLRKEVKSWIDDWIAAGQPADAREVVEWQKTLDVLNSATSKQDFSIIKGGNLYKVDIPDEAVDRFLDWDAPLSEQPAAVREALETAASRPIPNSDVYSGMSDEGIAGFSQNLAPRVFGVTPEQHAESARVAMLRIKARNALQWMSRPGKGETLYNSLGNADEASRFLNDVGIPGIKYFDGMSRSAGEGTRNFVLFDDDLVTILERNGEAMR